MKEYSIIKEAIDGTIMYWSRDNRWTANKRKRETFFHVTDAMETGIKIWYKEPYVLKIQENNVDKFVLVVTKHWEEIR